MGHSLPAEGETVSIVRDEVSYSLFLIVIYPFINSDPPLPAAPFSEMGRREYIAAPLANRNMQDAQEHPRIYRENQK